MRRFIAALAVVALMVGVVGAGVSMFLPSVLPVVSTLGTPSDVQAQINHQGVVAVSGVRFTGTGQFKFSIRDPDTSSNVWTNSADTSPADGVPDSVVSLTVTDGVYSVRLGDTGITNMGAISSSLFADGNLQLRVWFNDGTNGWSQLSPDYTLTSSPYSFAVADASISTAKLADNAVTSAKILDSAVTSAKIANGTIVDTDVNSSAAIVWSKLSKSGAVPSDVGAQAADADLDDLADGSLSGSKVGSGVDGANISAGTVTAAKLASDIGVWATSGGNVTYTAGKVGVNTTTPIAKLEVVTPDDTNQGKPQLYDDKYFTVGTGGAQGGSVFLSYNRTDGRGYIGALTPGIAWRALVLQPDANVGSVGIGVQSPQYRLHVSGQVGATGFVNTSSRQFKKDITELRQDEYGQILAKLQDIKVVRFRYRAEDNTTRPHIGMIAEDTPVELVSQDGQGIDLGQTVGCLIAAMKAQQQQIDDLRIQVQQLRSAH